MSRKILVPLDGSALAERALPYAENLAQAAADELVLLHVVSPLGWDLKPPLERDLLADLNVVVERVRAAGIAARPSMYNGYHTAPGIIIARAAREHGAGLIVMSTHGRGGVGRFVYGSTADEVLRYADVPLLLIPATGESTWPTDRPLKILVPLDRSELSREILERLHAVLDNRAFELLLVNVVELPTYAQVFPSDAVAEARAELEDVANGLRAAGRSVDVRVEVGGVAASLARVAEQAGADLIAMTTHGRGGLGRVVLGSVATGAVHDATVPLLLVRPAGLHRTLAEDVAGSRQAVAPHATIT
jgi:nucleotide-binding universal stress UspA family protein